MGAERLGLLEQYLILNLYQDLEPISWLSQTKHLQNYLTSGLFLRFTLSNLLLPLPEPPIRQTFARSNFIFTVKCIFDTDNLAFCTYL